MSRVRASRRQQRTLPLLATLTATFAFADAGTGAGGWSPDPADNLIIAGRNGEEVQAKILPLPDGGFYVSWFDNTDGGYDVRLQRLDVDGHALWPENGVLVADRSFSSTTDYGFSVDAADHALLSFQCCSQGGSDEHLVVARVTPDGELAWPAPGITVTAPGQTAAVSQLTATNDGNSVVVWMDSATGQGRAQKLAPDGDPLWGSTGVVIAGPGTASRFIADVKPGSDGNAIVSWSNQPGRVLYAQKLGAANGDSLWADGIRVSDAGTLQFGSFPPHLADGAGGAVFAYYDGTGIAFDVRVQHIDSDGVRRFGNNGTLATTSTTGNHVNPAGAFDAGTGDTYVAWVDDQVISMQTWHSLRVQRIDADGNRQWSDEGLALVPAAIATTGENALSRPVVLTAPEGVIVAWSTGNTSVAANPIRAQYLDRDGQAIWPEPLPIKTSPTRTSRPTGATSTAGYAAFVWSDALGNDPISNDVLGHKLDHGNATDDVIFADGFESH